MRKQIVIAMLAAVAMIAFWAFVSWGSSPETWLPESRFFYAFMVATAAIIGYVASADV